MRIMHVCQRCRMVFDTVDIRGGDPRLNAFMFSMSGLKNRSLCPKCGGWVVSVEEGEELPEEFRISTRQLFKAIVLSALVWLIFQWVASMAFLAAPVDDLKILDDAQKQIYVTAMFDFVVKVSLCGVTGGCLVSLFACAVATRRDDLNDPYPAELMPYGEGAVLFLTAAASAVAGVVIAVWIAPNLAPASIMLRDPMVRGLIGGVQALLAGSLSQKLLFKFCRRRA